MELVESNLFTRWFDGLADRKARAAITSRVDRLARGNAGDVKSIGEGVSELRIAFGPGYRVYFGKRGKVYILLLAGGDKASQKRDIAAAKKVLDAWKE